MAKALLMDKEKLGELRVWARSKYDEGYTPQEVKDALTRKGFSENDAELVISRGKNVKKFMYNLLMLGGILLFLAVLILLLSSIGRIKAEDTDLKGSKAIVLDSVQLSDIEVISIENFTKSKSGNMLIFTFLDETNLPVIVTIQVSNNNTPSDFSSYFYTLNQEIYSDFSIITTWSDTNFDAVDFAYSFEGREFVILQRIIRVNSDVIALSLKCEKDLVDNFKGLFDNKVREVIKIKELLIS